MFRIDNDSVIDATIAGGPARYINHSCQVTLLVYRSRAALEKITCNDNSESAVNKRGTSLLIF